MNPMIRNRELNTREIARGEVVLSSAPLQVNIELTGICNIDPPCVFCTGKNLGYGYPELDTAYLDRFHSLLHRSQRVTDDSFGEPLTHPSFLELARSFTDNGQQFTFVTNGLLLNRERSEALSLCGSLLGMTVSFNAATEETFRALTGRNLTKVLDNVRLFMQIYQHANQSPPDLTLNFIVMQINRREVMDFLELSHELGARALLSTLHPRPGVAVANFGYDFVYENEMLEDDDYLEIGGTAFERSQEIGLDLAIQWEAANDYALRSLAEPGIDIPCLIPWRFLLLQEHTASAFACPYHTRKVARIDGGQESAAWNSPILQEIRRDLLNQKIPRFCWSHSAACPLIFADRDRFVAADIRVGENDCLHLGAGWYSLETLPQPVRWTGRRASFTIDATGRTTLLIDCMCSRADLATNPLHLSVFLNGQERAAFWLYEYRWQVLSCALPSDVGIVKGTIRVWTPWRPHKLVPDGEAGGVDHRELGIAVRRIWTE